ncbi:hypothetical protein PVMG_02534 [Plasmodium vivax Mauritania I]|uniref:Uncharacterized protein n=1 Tax=Plasmodium vivax Mauritania I TaxID=1035515 RepID=A0A0J9TGK7_PLAVI|nr:hypothetical protein PVMG_02534 [Plasmodium vivax Mauritania I]
MDLSLSKEINEWKFKYPFLKKIWNLFEDFSNEVTDDDNPLHVVCDVIAAYYPEKINEYQEFCKILLKNLENVSKIKLQNYKYTMYKYLKTKTQIFRFTPARGWFRARNRATKASILLDDGPNEMLYNSPDSLNMESDNSEYNIGYHSTEDYKFE